jgi:excisionase family DNA binding protein
MRDHIEDVRARRDAIVDSGVARGLTIREAETLWPISRTTIYAAIKSGSLKSYKVGRSRILYPTDIDAWIRGNPVAA